MSTIEIESDYDQNLLAEKYNHMKFGDYPTDNDRRHLFAAMDAENMVRLVKHAVTYLDDDQQTLPIECALDIGCGQGNLLRTLLKHKLVKSTVGVDRSTHMIDQAKANSMKDADETYAVLNVTTDDLLKMFGRKFPLIIQSYMLSHAENVEQFSEILSNIARVCSGIFVGLISNPKCDFQNPAVRKLQKYGSINRQYDCDEEVNTKMNVDGMKYRVTSNWGKDNELTLVDHWYSPETYENVFRNAGFRRFEWMPLQLNKNEDQEEYLIDLIASKYGIGFIAVI